MKVSEAREGLLLATLPGLGTDVAWDLLRVMIGSFFANEEQTPLHPAEGAGRLAEGRGTHLVIIYPDPSEMLAEAMRSGYTPTESVSRWRQQMEPTLETYRRNRRNTTLVNAYTVREAPTELSQLLSRRVGISLQPPANDRHLSSGGDDPLMQVLASYLLANIPEIALLSRELMASSLSPLPSKRTHSMADSSYEAIGKADENAADIELLKSTLNLKQRENRALQEERDLVLEQVLKLQTRLEKEAIESEEKSRSLLKLTKEYDQLKADLNRIRSSRSWKLTAPLRSGKRPTPGKSGKRA